MTVLQTLKSRWKWLINPELYEKQAVDSLIASGVRTEITDRAFRCSNCRNIQIPHSAIFWMPDTDFDWTLISRATGIEQSGASGWCKKCSVAKAEGK